MLGMAVGKLKVGGVLTAAGPWKPWHAFPFCRLINVVLLGSGSSIGLFCAHRGVSLLTYLVRYTNCRSLDGWMAQEGRRVKGRDESRTASYICINNGGRLKTMGRRQCDNLSKVGTLCSRLSVWYLPRYLCMWAVPI